VGLFTLIADVRRVNRLTTVIGPEARFRLLKDEGWLPR
jgi:hypothetical protein